MEPISLTAGAIATLVLTKALEKTGEKLGEKVIEEGNVLMKRLEHKSPEIAGALQLVRQNPELVSQQPEDYGEAVLVKKVETAANQDPEIAEAVEALANAVRSQPSAIQNFTKLAEKIGMVVQGGIINHPTFNF